MSSGGSLGGACSRCLSRELLRFRCASQVWQDDADSTNVVGGGGGRGLVFETKGQRGREPNSGAAQRFASRTDCLHAAKASRGDERRDESGEGNEDEGGRTRRLSGKKNSRFNARRRSLSLQLAGCTTQNSTGCRAQVRLAAAVSTDTRLLFATHGVLLRRAMADP